MDYRIFNMWSDVNVCNYTQGCLDTIRETAAKVDWQKNPVLHQGIKPASAVCWSHPLPTELHTSPPDWTEIYSAFVSCELQFLDHCLNWCEHVLHMPYFKEAAAYNRHMMVFYTSTPTNRCYNTTVGKKCEACMIAKGFSAWQGHLLDCMQWASWQNIQLLIVCGLTNSH